MCGLIGSPETLLICDRCSMYALHRYVFFLLRHSFVLLFLLFGVGVSVNVISNVAILHWTALLTGSGIALAADRCLMALCILRSKSTVLPCLGRMRLMKVCCLLACTFTAFVF